MPDPIMVADLHCDTALKLLKGNSLDDPANHVTTGKLKRGGVKLQVFACWVSPKFRRQAAKGQALKMIAAVRDAVARHQDRLMLVTGRTSWRKCARLDKTGVLLAVEGGHACAGDIETLDEFHALGVRIVTLTWNNHNTFADSSAHAEKRGKDSGLTGLGRQFVARANQLGIIIDLSHSSPKTFWDVLECSAQPVLVSHSCAASLRPHHRNLSDGQITALAGHHGLLGINFYPGFLGTQRGPAGLQTVADQFAYIKERAGTKFLAMGSDFDGISRTPQGLDGSDKFPGLLEALRHAGFTKKEIGDVAGKNALRFLGW